MELRPFRTSQTPATSLQNPAAAVKIPYLGTFDGTSDGTSL